MSTSRRTIAVMPAYNAERTVRRVFEDIPPGSVDEVILVDDHSQDGTVVIARELGITVVEHERNTGYGGNQKTCYRKALEAGADFVVMLHPDYQYDARMIAPAVDVLASGNCDVILGNRIRTRSEALAGGMPWAKYYANRGLTMIENVFTGQNLGEWHSGFRAYTREVLEQVPWQRNSDDFVFDSQFLFQCVHQGFKLGDLPVPVRYFDEASSINLKRSSEYALLTLWTLLRLSLHRMGVAPCELFVEATTDEDV
jgi:glycosyltransferase involved in cell wall biosynthesis